MSLYELYMKSEKGDTFRIPENPTKYADMSFKTNMAANSMNPNVANAISNPLSRLSATNTTVKANSTIPGSRK